MGNAPREMMKIAGVTIGGDIGKISMGVNGDKPKKLLIPNKEKNLIWDRCLKICEVSRYIKSDKNSLFFFPSNSWK